MLAPDDRRVLLETLRPPDGYVVDRTIATTYTLDLVALLTAPLAFSMFDRLVNRDEASTRQRIDGFGLLHAVREHAARMSVFCQAGAIHKPAAYRQLFPYLEDSVVQVAARSDDGVFHAKLFVQRFVREDAPIRYRVTVPSRNLTFDGSWDTMLVLEGELRDRSRAFAANHPLADLIAGLPSLAIRPPAARITADVALVADELRRVDFERPDGIEALRFWSLGLDGKTRWPFEERIERVLVVSPFLTQRTLERLTESGKQHILLSRPEELEPLPTATLKRFTSIFTLHEGAEPEPEDEDAEPSALPAEPPPRGLHAKLFVADDGWNAHVWTGSANASTAAFENNVEILVQLTGKRARFGVDATLDGEKGKGGLRAILAPYTPAPQPAPQDGIKLELERRLRALRTRLVKTDMKAVVEQVDHNLFSIELRAKTALSIPQQLEASVRCWPISLPDTFAVAVESDRPGVIARFSRCSFVALTTFYAFELSVTLEGESCRETFVLHLPMEGAPEQREARILQHLLDEPSKVLQFLRMLLATDPFEAMTALDTPLGEGGASAGSGPRRDIPLLEALLRAFDRDPERLVSVERLLRELRSTPEGASLLPDDLEKVWAPIWQAHQEQVARGQR